MTSVKVYVYDLSQGLAKTLSYQLLGKHLDGIWHTGIVVYGKEYFFGSGGIDMCAPGGTILGPPHQVIDLGHSEIPEEIFLSYLTELSENDYRPGKYHLFDHNCNTFSNEVGYFLTNKNIPSHITDLPQSVSNTPLGQMLRSFVDRMSGVGPSNFHPQPRSDVHGAEASQPVSNSDKTALKKEPITITKVAIHEEELNQSARDYWKTISESATSLLRDVFQYATATEKLNWGLGPKHFGLIGKQLIKENSAHQQFILELFRVSVLKSNDVPMGMMNDRNQNWKQLLDDLCEQQIEENTTFHCGVIKLACNWVGQMIQSKLDINQSLRTSSLQYVVKALDGPTELLPLAIQLSYNLTCSPNIIQDDSVLGLGSILIHVLCNPDSSVPNSAYNYAAKALMNLFDVSEDIRQLAIVQGLDVNFLKSSEASQLQEMLQGDIRTR